MPDFVLGISHVAAFLVGALTWRTIAVLEGRAFSSPRPGEEPYVSDTSPVKSQPPRQPRKFVPVVLMLILTASMVIIGFGVQQYAYQRDQEIKQACMRSWGRNMVDILETRTVANAELEQYRQSAEDALYDSFGVFLKLRRQNPPPSDERAKVLVDEALFRVVTAKTLLDQKASEAARTRISNPFPELDCSRR